jgi:DNA repair ATPase RecN
MVSNKKQMEIGKIEKRLKEIRERRNELVELMYPYQKESDDLFEKAQELKRQQEKLMGDE